MGEFSYFNSPSTWEQGLKLLNDSGLNWTNWTYKCVSTYGNWGLVNQSVSSVNAEKMCIRDRYMPLKEKQLERIGNSWKN